MKNRILVVDDSPFITRVLIDILRDDYDVTAASNGVDGIAFAREQRPELILLDVEMPDMDGFEVLEQLKADSETERIPVIFLTGMVSPEFEERGFLCGAVDYITKPYNPTIVKLRIKTHMELETYRRKIEEQLDCDPLTDVHNRRGLERKLKEDIHRFAAQQRALSVMILDIDHFKLVNDTYGHLQGDLVLQKMGMILKKAVLGTGGYVARYGGEEFVIVLPEDRKASYELLNGICRTLEEAQIPNEKSSTSAYVTISIGGYTGIPKMEDVPENLIHLADDMLYQSKENGRNRITWRE